MQTFMEGGTSREIKKVRFNALFTENSLIAHHYFILFLLLFENLTGLYLGSKVWRFQSTFLGLIEVLAQFYRNISSFKK